MHKKTSFVSGIFNVLHPGHLRLLKFAKKKSDKLIVGLESDKIIDNKIYFSEKIRSEALQHIKWIDEVIITNDILKTIKKTKPDFVIKGKEFEGKKNNEKKILDLFGGKLLFNSGEVLISSDELIYNIDNNKRSILPKDYIYRHNIKLSNIKKIINNFKKLKVCVIGDIIVDEYIKCSAVGMSQEEATLVVNPIDSNLYLGGAGIVASHAASLNADVHLISVSGNDKESTFSKKILDQNNVSFSLFIDSNRPTTLKKRYRSLDKTLLKVSYFHQNAIPIELQSNIYKSFLDKADNIDLLVFSDFNYGCLTNSLIKKIIFKAREKNIFIVGDSQSSSQIGDIAKFNKSNLLTPTEREARLSLKNNQDGLALIAEKILKQNNLKYLFLKLSEEGFLINEMKKHKFLITDQIPALNKHPIDTAGAGDSLLITSGMALASKADIWESALIGAVAASIQVSNIGNVPITKKKLLESFI